MSAKHFKTPLLCKIFCVLLHPPRQPSLHSFCLGKTYVPFRSQLKLLQEDFTDPTETVQGVGMAYYRGD